MFLKLKKINRLTNKFLFIASAFATYFIGVALSSMLLKLHNRIFTSKIKARSNWQVVQESKDLTKMY